MIRIRLLFFLATALIAAAGPIYTLADLGTLGSSTMATALNAAGQTVGTSTTSTGAMLGFYATDSGLGTLSSPAGQSDATGINNGSQISGTQYFGNQTYATVWTNGVATTVAGAGSIATGINDAGDVSGERNGNAFITQNGTVIELGSFDGGSWATAYGISNAGQAVGYGMDGGGNFRGFIWTPSQGYSVLGTLGGANSYAMAINSSGVAAGSSQTSSGYSHAFTSNGNSLQDLGTLGGVASYGYGVNDEGNVVGNSWITGNAAMDGFLYEGGVMYDINSLLIDASGWQVTGLYGINDSNQLVGIGILNGVEHAVLLTDPPPPGTASDNLAAIPEPAAWTCTITGLVVLLLRSRTSVSRR